MRRIAVLAAGSAVALMCGAVPAFADNGPHKSTAVTAAGDVTLNNVGAGRCAGCHRAHTAQAGDLLKQAEPALCYTCHGSGASGASTDVEDGVGGDGKALRGGGFKYALIDTAGATGSDESGDIPVLGTRAETTSSHTVDGTAGTAWGNGPISGTANVGSEIQLRCGSCHDPHGNGNYRILRPIPNESGASTGVVIADTDTKTYTTTDYWQVEDTTAPAYIGNVSAWCSTCHTRYLATEDKDKDSSTDAIFRGRHVSNGTNQGGRSCIQCHVSHGSNASVGTPTAPIHKPTGIAGFAAGSKLLRIDNEGTCNMCH